MASGYSQPGHQESDVLQTQYTRLRNAIGNVERQLTQQADARHHVHAVLEEGHIPPATKRRFATARTQQLRTKLGKMRERAKRLAAHLEVVVDQQYAAQCEAYGVVVMHAAEIEQIEERLIAITKEMTRLKEAGFSESDTLPLKRPEKAGSYVDRLREKGKKGIDWGRRTRALRHQELAKEQDALESELANADEKGSSDMSFLFYNRGLHEPHPKVHDVTVLRQIPSTEYRAFLSMQIDDSVYQITLALPTQRDDQPAIREVTFRCDKAQAVQLIAMLSADGQAKSLRRVANCLEHDIEMQRPIAIPLSVEHVAVTREYTHVEQPEYVAGELHPATEQRVETFETHRLSPALWEQFADCIE